MATPVFLPGKSHGQTGGQLWNLLLLPRRVGPGYLLCPLTWKTVMRLQSILRTVERADP